MMFNRNRDKTLTPRQRRECGVAKLVDGCPVKRLMFDELDQGIDCNTCAWGGICLSKRQTITNMKDDYYRLDSSGGYARDKLAAVQNDAFTYYQSQGFQHALFVTADAFKRGLLKL